MHSPDGEKIYFSHLFLRGTHNCILRHAHFSEFVETRLGGEIHYQSNMNLLGHKTNVTRHKVTWMTHCHPLIYIFTKKL